MTDYGKVDILWLDGGWVQKLTPEQQQLCLEAFGDYLERMGYPLDQEAENDSES